MTPRDESSRSIPNLLTVVCVKWGTKYGAEYVNKLYRGVTRHLSIPHTFVCYTDDRTGLDGNIVVRELMDTQWSGWWNKAFLFADSVSTGLKGSRVLYIDLDTIIVGDITPLASFSGDFIIWGTAGLANEDREDGYNSSIMCWREGFGRVIYTGLCLLEQEVKQNIHRFDHWLEMIIPNAPCLQQVFPDLCIEYIASAQSELPKNAKIVSFPLDPKPHNASAPWIKEAWV